VCVSEVGFGWNWNVIILYVRMYTVSKYLSRPSPVSLCLRNVHPIVELLQKRKVTEVDGMYGTTMTR